MGCCGGKGGCAASAHCADSDHLGKVDAESGTAPNPSEAAKQAAGPEAPPGPGEPPSVERVSEADQGSCRETLPAAGIATPVLSDSDSGPEHVSFRNVPYGGPDDTKFPKDDQKVPEETLDTTPGRASSIAPTSHASAGLCQTPRRPPVEKAITPTRSSTASSDPSVREWELAAARQQELNEREKQRAAASQKEKRAALAEAAARQPPRKMLAGPEQGEPMQSVPRRRPPLPVVSTKAQAPPADRKGFFAKMKQIKQKLKPSGPAKPDAAAGGQRVFNSVGGRRGRGPKVQHASRPPAPVPVGPGKAARQHRPTRPTRPGQVTVSKADPERRTVVSVQHAAPRQAPMPAARRQPGHSPGPPCMQSVGSSSAEGTSPGHSPLPEHAPVRRPVAPAPTGTSDAAAYQGPPADEFGPGGYRHVVPGEFIKGFKVERILGDGAFGCVWQASHRITGTEVAIKVCKSDPECHRAAKVEVSMLSAMDDCARNTKKQQLRKLRERFFVAMHSHFNLRGVGGALHPCIILDLQGPDLVQLAEHHSGRCVAPVVVKTIMHQVLQALRFLSEMQVAHGDLKPENVLLGPGCQKGRTFTSSGRDLAAARLTGSYCNPARGETLAQSLLKQYAVKLVDFGPPCTHARPAMQCQRDPLLRPIRRSPAGRQRSPLPSTSGRRGVCALSSSPGATCSTWGRRATTRCSSTPSCGHSGSTPSGSRRVPSRARVSTGSRNVSSTPMGASWSPPGPAAARC
eukprot:TRINITY_DN26535_c0_g1_i3.p1 TRINITY_DN26535_c0_g1~~TRINITY_DN26535_c0_g1_i3.p1  ORF type:complete len:776 (+),score=99.57 TRINITY_DN26535_c0_g1_i3:102-2330(+)